MAFLPSPSTNASAYCQCVAAGCQWRGPHRSPLPPGYANRFTDWMQLAVCPVWQTRGVMEWMPRNVRNGASWLTSTDRPEAFDKEIPELVLQRFKNGRNCIMNTRDTHWTQSSSKTESLRLAATWCCVSLTPSADTLHKEFPGNTQR